uniref:Uncharacterized protein n=1 Tax=Populus trichocarpa TaxID=3694 RepID=A0A3N7GVC9_POPTR
MQCPKIQNLCLQMGLSALPKPQLTNMKSLSTGRVLKPSSLQLCVQMNEPEKVFKSRVWNSVQSENSSSVNIWDYSDAEDTPTSSWSTLPNSICSAQQFEELWLCSYLGGARLSAITYRNTETRKDRDDGIGN